jgi:hypothetical protein
MGLSEFYPIILSRFLLISQLPLLAVNQNLIIFAFLRETLDILFLMSNLTGPTILMLVSMSMCRYTMLVASEVVTVTALPTDSLIPAAASVPNAFLPNTRTFLVNVIGGLSAGEDGGHALAWRFIEEIILPLHLLSEFIDKQYHNISHLDVFYRNSDVFVYKSEFESRRVSTTGLAMRDRGIPCLE